MTSRRNLNVWLAVLVCFVVSASLATATTIYVPTDYTTIQGAINEAVDGNEIEVAPGTYYEGIDFLGKAIRLYSIGGPQVTTIDGTGHYHVVQCVSGEGSGTILDGFTITGGNANGSGGGGMLNNNSSPMVTNCIFTSNEALRGGGMLNDQNSNPTVTNCIFTCNTGTYGGGMYNAYGSNSTVTNCTFECNIAPWFGGGMDNKQSDPTVTNCIFTSNWGYFGGGMLNEANANPTVTNCTFIGNAASKGGGIYTKDYSSPNLTNCIFWGDIPNEISLGNSTITVTYSDVQGGWTGTGNIDADPMFADAEGRLSPDSPCIDTGDNSAVPADITTDLDGNLRIINDTVDMGAYEYPMTLVQIDIKPGSCPNAININGNGVIPVGIVGSVEFDVTQVVIDSLSFAGLEVRVKPNGVEHCSISDVTGPEGVPDGCDDLVCHFVDDPLQWSPGDGVADLTGTFLVDGTVAAFKGSDEITVVP